MTEYTLKDLDDANAELARLEQAFDNYSGNNPDKFQSDIRSARRQVNIIALSLKVSGVIPRTEQELLWARLDKAFPKAQHKDVVELDGKRFKRRVYPGEMSRSGRVKRWGVSWEPVR
jgi:hypothetical protein